MPQSDTPALPLNNLRHPRVRDLAWACFSPPLVLTVQVAAQAATSGPAGGKNNAVFALTPERQHWLEQLDRQPGPLLDHLGRRPTQRLGLYFEALWHFFLTRDSAVDLLAHNLPVRKGGRTLGEFDCLYYCHRRQRPVHLELAVKFYLHHGGSAGEWRHWLGPNSRDRLDRKLARLLHHQSALSQIDAGQAQLAQRGIDSPLTEIELKGYLFHHWQQPAPRGPYGVNPARRLQRWCHLRELNALMAGDGVKNSDGKRYRTLARLDWLAPALGDDADHPALTATALRQQLQAHFAGRGSAQLVAALDAAGKESQRFFVCADHWPG
ncbi:DUF1853 family protein [Parahaliea mediterranea]|uniref:DUF1853 family protein n=1 Tax=Parahaliea mediterranea TaxID=651086 RepID=UPI0013009D33|nr:DUF1853 family protein [Parahaliea mediterranea]